MSVPETKSKWVVERKISFGDLATILLLFMGLGGYIVRNETDKSELRSNQSSAEKRFEEFKTKQNETDKGQDGQIRDGIMRIEQKLETLNGYLLMSKRP